MTEYTLSELAKITGAKPRSIQLWADAGIIKAAAATERAGSGTHRRFSRQEAVIACVLATFADQKIAIGGLSQIARWVRGMSEWNNFTHGQVDLLGDALRGVNTLLVVKWGSLKGKYQILSAKIIYDRGKTEFSDVFGSFEKIYLGGLGGKVVKVPVRKFDVVSITECLRALGPA
jgi:DNA-binding transcriptional MerR regulator